MLLSNMDMKLLSTERRICILVMKVMGPIAIISGCLYIFAPSSKTIAAMYIIPRIANNEKVIDVGNRIYELAIEWAEDIKPSKKDGQK